MVRTWLPHKRRHVRATTAYRYAWFVDRYINPAIGTIPLSRLRADHLDPLTWAFERWRGLDLNQRPSGYEGF